jgi:hypothetical protein
MSQISSPIVSPSSSAFHFDRKARATQSRNPVSLRLYKVLGTNFDDEATREALQTLSELYATSASTAKGKEPLRNLEDDELEEEWIKPTGVVADELLTEAVPGESAAQARKNLRRDMERKLAEGSHQFLKAFGEVDEVGFTCALVLILVSQNFRRNWKSCNSTSLQCTPAVMRQKLNLSLQRNQAQCCLSARAV